MAFNRPQQYLVGVHLLENREESNPVHETWSRFEGEAQPNQLVYGFGESMHLIPNGDMDGLSNTGYLGAIISAYKPYMDIGPHSFELVMFGRAPGGCLDRHLYELIETSYFQGPSQEHIFTIALAMQGIPFRKDSDRKLFLREMEMISTRVQLRVVEEEMKLNLLRRTR